MKRAFVSFDFDHDEVLKTFLIGQAKHDDTPFELADWSIKEAIDKNWQAHAHRRIKSVDVVIVICGQHTDTAIGVSAELAIAQQESVPYFFLKGYADLNCKYPKGARATDKMYKWTWENLKTLINGGR